MISAGPKQSPIAQMKTDTNDQCKLPDALQLARVFSALVLRDVEAENHEDLKRRTIVININNDTICATHDFCDPNESMMDAWRALTGEWALDNGNNPEIADLQLNRMNDAWAIAKRNLFWLS